MIKLDNLTKFYPLSNGDKHFVFREFTFIFPDDCSIGLIGRNGAGKSTLMRLLSGADIPNAGKVITDKKISWPVGLAGGFQQSLSARDNVKFVARVYGYKGEALEEKVRYIEEFAEIGKYFDEPMNTYSSGMRSRIGFGVHLFCDIVSVRAQEIHPLLRRIISESFRILTLERNNNAPNISGMLIDFTADSGEIYFLTLVREQTV